MAILDAGTELEEKDAAAATAATTAVKDEETALAVPALGEAVASTAAADSSSKWSVVALNATQKVAFSRWCKKQSISIGEMSNASELKSAWLLSPENAKSILIKSTRQPGDEGREWLQ